MTRTDPLAPYDAVLVLSYGGPQGPDDVLPFMRNATAGRGIPDERLLQVSGHYAGFDGVSPINARNAEMLDALRAELARRGSRLPVVIGNRNWHPFVSEAMRELTNAGAQRILTMTTSAYGSYSGCRQYREDTAAALAQLATGSDGTTGQGFEADAAARVGGAGGAPVALTVDKTRPFYNTPGMLAANVDAIVSAFDKLTTQGVPADGIRLVLVTHSVPVTMEEGSSPDQAMAASATISSPRPPDHCPQPRPGFGAPSHPAQPEPGVAADLSTEISYVEQHQRFIEVLVPAVVRRLGLANAPESELVYCSRSGPPQARWLEPDINDHLQALAEGQLTDGRRVSVPAGVVIAPIGFVADHMEVVYDLDTEARQTAADLGIPYVRAATAGTHPAFIASLADLLLERAAVARGEEVTPTSTTGAGPFHTVCPEQCCRSGASNHPDGRPQGRPGGTPVVPTHRAEPTPPLPARHTPKPLATKPN
ncbi:ferrochelatase [Actinomyces trachealis]|uniref:ferrochelatase n=1 Tax=Actinomyces trachealis TaxID=2763540 RepID=UPI0018929358|nr:ferrochelatase [Actinomyces trachealis]